ncbi:MAG: hypothetical protein IJM21_05505 [Clostridia bacterium]|nr:hypothetical protein [Clostridia bacterium]
MILYAVTTALAGAVILAIGIAVYRGNTKLIHDYHQTRVKEEDLPAYGREFAKGLFLLAAALFLSGLINLIGEKGPVILVSLMILAAGIVASLIWIARVQKKYNGGFF